MSTGVLKALIQNSTILVVAFLFITRLSRWRLRKRRTGILFEGLAFFACGISALLFSYQILPGVLIDMRAPILVVAAMYGGPVVGLTAAAPLALYRIAIGGTGVHAGLGIIASSFLFGILLRRYEHTAERKTGFLYQAGVGLGSAFIYYVWIMSLPGSISIFVLEKTMFPLTVASVMSVLAIHLIRTREESHQKLLEELREMSDLFEEIALDENIGVVIMRGYRIVYVNDSLLRKFGFSFLDPEHSDLLSIVDHGNRADVIAFLDMLNDSSTAGSHSLEVTIPDRGTRTFLIHARKVLYRCEQAVLAVAVDVTRLADAETELEQGLNQLQLALEASGAVLWKADLRSDTLSVADDFFDVLCYSPDEEPPLFSHFLLAFEMSGEMRRALEQLADGTEDAVFGEISRTGESGRGYFNIGARVTEFQSDGSPSVITGMLFDTTEIRRKELCLMEKELDEMQSGKMESIGRLAGGVAHDFNNLLHVIMGYSDILRRVASGDPVIEELTEPIKESAERGRELVKQLLLFSRDRVPELKPLNLLRTVENFTRLVDRIIEESISITVSLEEVPMVRANRGQVEQVLMNLCLNSRDAMPDGGNIRITLGTEHVTQKERTVSGALQPGEYALVRVADTGSGVPEENLGSIFEPFFTTKQVDRGTGLGLATVQGVMKGHGGMAVASNGPGGGLEVSLFFPVPGFLEENASDAPHEATDKRRRHGKLTVLLAEDDPQVMNLAVEGLGAMGIHVLRASDGDEAVRMYDEMKESIDVLVFDVVMPRRSGPDALAAIRARGGTTPVLFTTGYAGDKLGSIPQSELTVLAKPYGMDELARLVMLAAGSEEDSDERTGRNERTHTSGKTIG